MQLAIRLLQLPILELSQKIEEELLQNPVLEEVPAEEPTEQERQIASAKHAEESGQWYIACFYYREAGNMEKMAEMAREDIQDEYEKGDFRNALITATKYLVDEDEIRAVFEKFLENREIQN